MVRQGQNRLPKQFGDFGALQAIEGCVAISPTSIGRGMIAVPPLECRPASLLHSGDVATSRFFDQRDVPALFVM